MNLYKTEGIVLRTFPFQEYDLIVTLFSPDLGIAKFIGKGHHRAKQKNKEPLSTLTLAEVVYTVGRSDLLNIREATVRNVHMSLRQTLPRLESGCDLAQALLQSQLPRKKAPKLYELFSVYLQQLPLISDPLLLAASFRLKVMRYDGLLHLTDQCSTCQTPLTARFLTGGESFCTQHAPPYALSFTEEEAQLTWVLAFSRAFSQMNTLTLPDHYLEKVQQLFKNSYSH